MSREPLAPVGAAPRAQTWTIYVCPECGRRVVASPVCARCRVVVDRVEVVPAARVEELEAQLEAALAVGLAHAEEINRLRARMEFDS